MILFLTSWGPLKWVRLPADLSSVTGLLLLPARPPTNQTLQSIVFIMSKFDISNISWCVNTTVSTPTWSGPKWRSGWNLHRTFIRNAIPIKNEMAVQGRRLGRSSYQMPSSMNNSSQCIYIQTHTRVFIAIWFWQMMMLFTEIWKKRARPQTMTTRPSPRRLDRYFD